MLPVLKRCSVYACERPVIASGFCDMHYRRIRRHGHLDQTRPADWGDRRRHPLYLYWKQIRRNGMPICQEWHDDFWAFASAVGERPSVLHSLYRPDQSVPTGPGNAGWATSKVGPARDEDHAERREKGRTRMADYQRMRRAADPLHDFREGLRRNHGIELEDFEAMAESQNEVCAICGRPEARLSTAAGRTARLCVDHRHNSTEIRGLLCSFCNTSVGLLDDSPALLQRAIDYLRNPPAAALGLLHSGKFKAKRRKREPSPYAEVVA